MKKYNMNIKLKNIFLSVIYYNTLFNLIILGIAAAGKVIFSTSFRLFYILTFKLILQYFYYIHSKFLLLSLIILVIFFIISLKFQFRNKLCYLIIFSLFFALVKLLGNYPNFNLDLFTNRAFIIGFSRYFLLFLLISSIIETVFFIIKKISEKFIIIKLKENNLLLVSPVFLLILFIFSFLLPKYNIVFSLVSLFLISSILFFLFSLLIIYFLSKKIYINYIFVLLLLVFFIFKHIFPIPSVSQLPNIIFITIDALRADYLSLYRTDGVKMANLERYIQKNKGYVFKQCVSPAPITIPSLPRIFAINPKISDISQVDISFQEMLADKGYECIAFVHNALIEMQMGSLFRGFDYFWIYPGNKGIFTNEVKKQMYAFSPRHSEDLLYLIKNYINRRKMHRPLFLWAHFFDPHAPYSPPPQFKLKVQFDGDMIKLREKYKNLSTIDPKLQKDIITLYKAEIRYTEKNVYALLKVLEEKGYFENSIIIISSDHGEAFGENGIYEHGYSMQQSEIYIPLIIFLPKKYSGAFLNKYVNETFSTVNLFPLIDKILSKNNIKFLNLNKFLDFNLPIIWKNQVAVFENQHKLLKDLEKNKFYAYSNVFNSSFPVKQIKFDKKNIIWKRMKNKIDAFSKKYTYKHKKIFKELKSLGYIN